MKLKQVFFKLLHSISQDHVESALIQDLILVVLRTEFGSKWRQVQIKTLQFTNGPVCLKRQVREVISQIFVKVYLELGVKLFQ